MAEAMTETSETTPYEIMGEDRLRRLTARFYALMEERKDVTLLRAMHAGDLAPMTEKLTGFLRAWLGGPRDYFESEARPCMMSLHRGLAFGAEEANQWLSCMDQALRETGVREDLRDKIQTAFTRMAQAMRTR
jgi:hemoglobin